MRATSLSAVLILHGELAPTIYLADVTESTYVVAVDGGLAHTHRLGLTPNVVVGDMDSATDADLAWARELGARIEVSPGDKDETDLELGLAHITARHSQVVVIGGEGGAPGHLFGNLLSLASTNWAHSTIEWRIANATVRILHPGKPWVVSEHAGERVSLLPVHGSAAGIETTGLQWSLNDAELRAGQSRGISNKTTEVPATVSLTDGVLVIVTEDVL